LLLVRRLRAHPQYALLASRVDPEDIVQDVWTRTLRPGALDGFEHRGRGSLRAYLLKVLDCTVTDTLRRNGAQKRGGQIPHVPLGTRPDEHTPPLEVPSPDPTPTQVARTHELADRFEQSLEEPARTMWQLAERDGLSYEDIARRLGVTSAVVRGMLHRARKRFDERS
jgi:RNA polymerase sigma-70 factor (ECF subfamily)